MPLTNIKYKDHVRSVVNAPWLDTPETRTVIKALTAGGGGVRFVGGCVRDTLIGRPLADIDIATTEDPNRVIKRLKTASIGVNAKALSYGTVIARVANAHFEITTLRVDTENYGRQAKVKFSENWEEDALRRDFTINAIYCDPDGVLFDPTGGVSDLESGIVRFVGDPDRRIKEDFLRILRFFRFTALYGALPPDRQALIACIQNAESLLKLSGERIANEIFSLLRSKRAAEVIRIMHDASILQYVLEGDNDLETLEKLVAVDGEDPVPLRRFIALVGQNLSRIETLGKRLNLAVAQKERMIACTVNQGRLKPELKDHNLRNILYKLGTKTFIDIAYLAWAKSPESEDSWRNYLSMAREWSAPEFPVKGKDVVALGVSSGPEIGMLLKALEQWWACGDFRYSRCQCLQKLKTMILG